MKIDLLMKKRIFSTMKYTHYTVIYVYNYYKYAHYTMDIYTILAFHANRSSLLLSMALL